MYVVKNKEGAIVGYHVSEEVVFEYVLKYNKYSEHDEANFEYIKDKKFYKYIRKNKGDDKKYLLRYNNTYIPEMFIDSETLVDNGFIQEIKYSRDTIDTLMSCYDNLDDKQMKQLGQAYKILSNIIKECSDYTPDIGVMWANKHHIAEMTNSDDIFRFNLEP